MSRSRNRNAFHDNTSDLHNQLRITCGLSVEGCCELFLKLFWLFSTACIFEKAIRASGKLGGVAGVFVGAFI